MEMAMRTYLQYVLPSMRNELVMLRQQNREWMLQQHTHRTRYDTLLDAVYMRRESNVALADRFFLGSLVNRYLHTDGIWFLERFHVKLMQRSKRFHMFAWHVGPLGHICESVHMLQVTEWICKCVHRFTNLRTCLQIRVQHRIAHACTCVQMSSTQRGPARLHIISV